MEPDRRLLAALAASALSVACTPVGPQEVDDSFASEDPFAAEIAAFVAADAESPPPACATLFAGSSSFVRWTTLAEDMAPRVVINRGFGGSEMSDLEARFDEIVAPYRPREILVYEGDNDIARGKSAEEVAAGLARFMELKAAALGETPVFFVSIKPSKLRVEQIPEQARANALVAAMAAERADLAYIDVASPMLDEKGEPRDLFVEDGLHMTAEGYAIWTPIVRAALDGTETTAAPGCS